MLRFSGFRPSSAAINALLLGPMLAFFTASPAHAGGQVTDCISDTDFTNKLAGGGTITFACGTATLPWSGTKTVAANTTIDGGGAVTFSGVFGYRLFSVNNGATLTLQNITLINGYNPDSAGGAAVSNNGHLILDRVTIKDMVDSAFNGGAIATAGALDVLDSTFLNNKATNGGAIYANGAGAIVSIQDSTFQQNQATGTQQNVSGFGGAVYVANGAVATISASDISSNTANDGGGIYVANSPSELALQGSKLRSNFARAKGGALLNAGKTTLTDASVSRNATDGVSSGGGIFNYGTLKLTNATLNNNKSYGGGALWNFLGNATLTNVTISGNTASAYAGGLYNQDGTSNLTNVTLQSNSAGFAGGILNANTANTKLNLTNVILAGGGASGNCKFDKLPDTSESNLSSDDTCNFGASRDSLDLKLGPLETNGGSTLTHRLKAGSPAIDNGVFVITILTDQRSITRPRGASFDVGAVEFVPCEGAPTKPALLSPLLDASITAPVTLDWTGPDCATRYKVQVRLDQSTGSIVLNKRNVKKSQLKLKTSALLASRTYAWQVSACNGKVCTAGDWWEFRVK